jgi:hypothetical protein
VVRGFARASTLTTACFIGLGVSSCSLLLDWSGYTDGGIAPIDAPNDATADAADAAADAADADADAKDAHDSSSARDTSVSDALAVPDVEMAETAPPARCGPTTCGGCCTSDGFCAGGSSPATCGVGANACEDCAQKGQSCDHGVCVPFYDAAAACTNNSQCSTTVCIPVVQMSCCRSDGTCGCQVAMPAMGTCM